MRLRQLKAALRKGKSPEDLGFRYLGRGAFRSAWTKAGWVVKRQSRFGDFVAEECCGDADSLWDRCDIRPAPSHYVGIWEIQRRYRPAGKLTKQELRLVNRCFSATNNDVHGKNLGRTRSGRLVAFDY